MIHDNEITQKLILTLDLDPTNNPSINAGIAKKAGSENDLYEKGMILSYSNIIN